MSEHHATVQWERGNVGFRYEDYSRDHVWTFGNDLRVAASATADYLGSPDKVDPEEAFVAAVASCHMLTFLAIAARKGLVVDRYEDAAVGYLEKNADGKLAVTRIDLRPKIVFTPDTQPTAEQLRKLHTLSHEECFIGNSVRTDIAVRPD